MMDLNTFITFVKEIIFLIIVFSAFLTYAMMRSSQSLVNLTLGLYLALLISIEFPYYDFITGGAGGGIKTESLLSILVFTFFTFLSTLLFAQRMPTDSSEPGFNEFGKKLLYTLGATILIMTFSYNVLPVTELITPGSPIQYLFASSQSFFYWLLVPLMFLFFL